MEVERVPSYPISHAYEDFGLGGLAPMSERLPLTTGISKMLLGMLYSAGVKVRDRGIV